MTTATLTSLLLLTLAATLAPLLVDVFGRLVALPVVVVEIAFGVVLGPDALGLVKDDAVVALLASLGLTLLMFFAGFEIDFTRVRGAPGRLALLTWGLSLVVGFSIGFAMHLAGLPDSGLVIGLALTTTALGVLVPILKDSGESRSVFGVHVMSTGAVGEFGPILAVSLLLGSRAPTRTALLLVAFAAIAVLAAALAMRPRPANVSRVVAATLRTSGQLAVRLTLLIVVALVWAADELGLDILLGAFSAGVVVRLFLSRGDSAEVEVVTDKLEAVGFGFLIPIFFIVSGVRFDLSGLLSSTSALLLLPAIVVLFLVVRGLPVLLVYRSTLDVAHRRALALFAASALPLVVVIANIGVETGRLQEHFAAALVGAAMVSVAVLPLVALRLHRGAGSPRAPDPATAGRVTD
jgi:Kef-type K+ transport system membrane component KefB